VAAVDLFALAYGDVPVLSLDVAVGPRTSGVQLFGGRGDPMSNFGRSELNVTCPFCGQTLVACTVEHGFQASKATTCEDFHAVLACEKPDQARAMGKKIVLRPDWDEPDLAAGLTVKAVIMLDLLRLKYALPRYHRLLQETGNVILIENAPWDPYWGAGKNGKGRNALGRLLMKVRAEQRLQRLDVPIYCRTPPVLRAA
jgi:ribA/ribD-fused uncharacterized protein